MMDRTTTGVSSARSMSHDDPQILTEPPTRIADLIGPPLWYHLLC